MKILHITGMGFSRVFIDEYACTHPQCQEHQWHDEHHPLFAAHLGFQSRHGTRERYLYDLMDPPPRAKR